jgi:hypothetical protein
MGRKIKKTKLNSNKTKINTLEKVETEIDNCNVMIKQFNQSGNWKLAIQWGIRKNELLKQQRTLKKKIKCSKK